MASDHDRLPQGVRDAAEGLYPTDDLSRREVAEMLTAAGADPEALVARLRQATTSAPPFAPPPHRLETCADFIALLPDYRAGTLSPERILLLRDHWSACPACRQLALPTRERAASLLTMPAPPSSAPTSRRLLPLALASAAALLLAAGIWGSLNGLLPGQAADLATVESETGGLYAVAGAQVRAVPAGYTVAPGEQLRTGSGASAALRLQDGSRVEVAPRSDVSFSRGWSGSTVFLNRGQVILTAAHQRLGQHLYVSTPDARVAVTGTVFSVNATMKGDRVAVLQGRVALEHAGLTRSLGAGEVATTNPLLAVVPIAEEVNWSQNAPHYLALLGEAVKLQTALDAIPPPALRYQSNLVAYVPASTAVYAAMPNVGGSIAQAATLFENELGQSPDLQSWWNQRDGNAGALDVQAVADRIRDFARYLGDEIVFAAPVSGAPVALAEVRQPGLASHIASLAAANPQLGLTLVEDPANPPAVSGRRPLLVYLTGDHLAASTDAASLQAAAVLLRQPGSGTFAASPLYQQIAPLYQRGASWLFAADLEKIPGHPVQPGAMMHPRFLVAEKRDTSTSGENRVALIFPGARQGAAALLAAPGPMGGLDFISPGATFAADVLTAAPADILARVAASQGAKAPAVDLALAGVFASTLGGEVTVALDGPMLPLPSWVVAVEVNDSATVQNAITQALATAGRPLAQQQVGDRTYYTVNVSNPAVSKVVYTFVDSYWLAAPTQAILARAIADRANGYTLPRSAAFQSQLPADGFTNFSALVYHDLGAATLPLAQTLSAMGVLTPQQKTSIDALNNSDTPGLVYAYGQPDRIVVASNSGFLGMDLETLMGFIAARGTRGQPHP